MNLLCTKGDLPEGVRGMRSSPCLTSNWPTLSISHLQAKQAHWNVKGPQFLSLHALFDQTAETVEEFADIMAERAVQLGGLAHGTVQAIVQKSRLPLYGLDLFRSSDHLSALSAALALFAATARTAIMQAATAGDADTADVMTQVSRETDSLLWKVAAHIPEAWELAAIPVQSGSIAKPPRVRRLDAN